jgi:hypothetical protein
MLVATRRVAIEAVGAVICRIVLTEADDSDYVPYELHGADGNICAHPPSVNTDLTYEKLMFWTAESLYVFCTIQLPYLAKESSPY